MIDQKKILAVVPARGGSKGVPLKNLRPLQGIPLVALAGHFTRQLSWLDRAVVSTDHEEIGRVAEGAGLTFAFTRPPELSGDRIGDWDVLSHALGVMEKKDNCVYDVILMLQPTSPFRRVEHVTNTVKKLIEGNFDAVWTVSPTEAKGHPLKQYTVVDDKLDNYDPRGAQIIARQQLTPVYHRNGVAYAITRECLVEQRSILGKRPSAVIIDEPMANIDTEEDLVWAEFLLTRQNRKLA